MLLNGMYPLRTAPPALLLYVLLMGSQSCPLAAEQRPAESNEPPLRPHNSPKSPWRSAALATPARAVPVLREMVPW